MLQPTIPPPMMTARLCDGTVVTDISPGRWIARQCVSIYAAAPARAMPAVAAAPARP